MNLTPYKTNDGIELYIDNQTGEAFASISGYSRMSGVAMDTISHRKKGVQSDELKTAEVLTPGGLQGVQLLPAKIIFRWMIKDNPELSIAMGEVGATVYLHKLAGYTVKSTAIEPVQPVLSPKDDFLKDLLTMGIDCAKYLKDDRAMMVYSTQLQNLVDRVASPASPQNLLPVDVWLTLSEILERAGYPISRKAYQNSLGQIGKLVKAHYEADTGEKVKITQKSVGTNHKSTEIKLYPESYSDRVIEIAEEYWIRKNIG